MDRRSPTNRARFGHWKTQTFTAGLRCGGLTARFVIDAPNTYVEAQLAQTRQPSGVDILAYESEHVLPCPSRNSPRPDVPPWEQAFESARNESWIAHQSLFGSLFTS
jgi:hypothetical protein